MFQIVLDQVMADTAVEPSAEPGPNNPGVVRSDLFTKDELIPFFDEANYAVFGGMLLISAAIGVFFWWRGQKSTEEYLMASRSMGTIPMTLSLVASFMSAITLLGTPAELYVSGTQYVALVLAYPLVTSNNTSVLNFELRLNLISQGDGCNRSHVPACVRPTPSVHKLPVPRDQVRSTLCWHASIFNCLREIINS